jgi:hypothetical protein
MEKESITGVPWSVANSGAIPGGNLTIENGGLQSTPINLPKNTTELLKKLAEPVKLDGSVNLSVKRYFTDNTGLVLDKNTIPNAYKTKYPVFIWGNADFDGSFKYALQVSPTVNGTVFLYKFIAGESFDWFGIQGGDIQNKYSSGDLVLVFADSKSAPTLLIYIVISMVDKSYSTLLKESIKSNIQVLKFLYILDNDANYNESIGFIQINNVGVYKNDFFQPFSYQQPNYQQNNFIIVPLQFKLHSKIGLSTYFQFATEQMNFEFKVKY